ncbi:9349_t:CDS:2 [Funneliformis caledonium]|uniref:9349_t:CDS:1 n=1 Tax=Funneliformis caledonium TaxID=1117310 RepID=A0A9N9CI96_9GLOM|nr:9349_t:CDS:2 [Funneliformis caledonium]
MFDFVFDNLKRGTLYVFFYRLELDLKSGVRNNCDHKFEDITKIVTAHEENRYTPNKQVFKIFTGITAT